MKIELSKNEMKTIRLAVSNLQFDYEKTLKMVSGKELYESSCLKMIEDCKGIIEKMKWVNR